MDPIEGVDEDYENTGRQPELDVPMLRMISSPRASVEAAPAIAFVPMFDQRDPMSWARDDPARRTLDLLMSDAELGAMHYHPRAPRVEHVVNQFAPQRQPARPTQGRRATEERQWRRLNEQEQTAIRGFLRRIPCAVTHASELGMMRLINRFRSRRSGGAKKQQNKRSKTHKTQRCKSHKRNKRYSRKH